MWFKAFRDYPVDSPLRKETVEPGKGIIGCEMHEVNGWNDYPFISENHMSKSPNVRIKSENNGPDSHER